MNGRSTLHLAFVALGVASQELSLGLAETADCVAVVITSQPHSLTVLQNCPATFSVGVSGTPPYFFQWFRDGQQVPEATNSSYTNPFASASDNGVRFHATISNACSQAISSEGSLYVSLDVVPPRLLRARGDASLERVIAGFAVGGCAGFPGLDPDSAQDPSNYSFAGGLTVSNADLEPNGTTVILTTSRQRPDTLYTLSVQGISELSGNVIAPDSEATFQSWVVLDGPDPEVVPPPVGISRSGPDIWITWPPGSLLQSADDLAGPWQTLPDVDSPYRATTDGSTHFYRALFDP